MAPIKKINVVCVEVNQEIAESFPQDKITPILNSNGVREFIIGVYQHDDRYYLEIIRGITG